jgi:nitrite reductase/ring-hydroxylating ferredoxin subunit/uncharacterized membrane protein
MKTLRAFVDSIGENEALEPVADQIGDTVRPLFAPRAVKNALAGVWLGHRLHPLLTDAVIGTWASAGLLDLVGDRQDEHGAQRLIGAGLVAAVPTMAAGLSDYSDLYSHGRRVALVHLLAADAAVVLQVASWLARRSGRTGSGRLLSFAALGVTVAVGYLGAHMSYVLGVGVDHTAFHEGPEDWEDVGSADEVTTEPRTVRAGDYEILLIRVDGQLVALANGCSHAGCALTEGDIADGVITCACHGSQFRLIDGTVVRGPAASPQLRYDVREEGGRISVRGSR